MPKRRRGEGERGGGRATKRRRRHLYLVFDDWSRGYTIRKVNLPPGGSDSDDNSTVPPQAVSGEGAEQRLTKPFFRLEAPRGLPQYFASAFGTRIMATHPREEPGADDGSLRLVPESMFPIFDVRSRGVIFGPKPNTHPARPIYLSVVGEIPMLFALGAGTFELLLPPPLDQHGGGGWFLWSSWSELPEPPFERQHVTSYAVHPDRGTILFSTENDGTAAATFAFDMAGFAFVWRRHAEWALPFTGCAHFDHDLGAFVGLCKDPDTLGHLCSCPAASTSCNDFVD